MACKFCDFVSKKRKTNQDGSPFLPIHQTKHTLSFLATDFPTHQDDHLLIIPKKHFSSITLIPNNILSELITQISIAVKVMRSTHSGANVLLNDGFAAGQRIKHTHFHVIPRDKKDGIIIEKWKKRKMSQKSYIELTQRLKARFKKNL